MVKITTEEFIEKAIKVHGNLYDYSKTIYDGRKTKLIITCNVHGDFEQTPNTHLKGGGCQKCKNDKIRNSISKNLEYFIEKSKSIHGDKYDYSKAIYESSRKELIIICPIHGEFLQSPTNHYSSYGCPICSKDISSKNQTKTTEQFIIESKSIHGNKYDYSKTCYIGAHSKVILICKDCGHEFEQNANSNLNGFGCPNCNRIAPSKKRLTQEQFLEKAKEIHGDKYSYDKTIYVKGIEKIEIYCNKCKEYFWQGASEHLSGRNHMRCCGNDLKTTEEFIKQSKKVHGNKFDYSECVYVHNKVKVKLICNDCGEEVLQIPNSNLKGNSCPYCSHKLVSKTNCLKVTHPHLLGFLVNKEDGEKYTAISSNRVDVICPDCGYVKNIRLSHLSRHGLGCNHCSDGISVPEKFMSNILQQLGLNFEREKTFTWSDNRRYDFYLPKTNQIFEVHGGFHTKDTTFKTKEQSMKIDTVKRNMALNNGIKHYDEIIADVTDYEFLKENYSKCLESYFNLDNVDYLLAWENSQKSKLIEVCKYFKENPNSTFSNLMEIFSVKSRSTIARYLKEGSKFGLCEYNTDELKSRNKKKTFVYDLNFNLIKIFKSKKEIHEFYGLSLSTISHSIKTGKPVEKLGLYFKDSEILS